jgi:hypothetical protein
MRQDDGRFWVLGALGALALGSLSRKTGSFDAVLPLTFTRSGFPWPKSYPLYHATTALRAIGRQGFRTRSMGAKSSLGGGTDRAVSFTVDERVADAVLVGLYVLRHGARRQMSLRDLWDYFLNECPKSAAAFRDKNDVEHNLHDDEMRDRGLIHEYYSFSRQMPEDAIPVGQGWMGRDKRFYHSWWRSPVTRQQKAEQERSWMWSFVSLYNHFTALGSSEKECIWPLFTGTDMAALADVEDEDLGIVVATSDIDRICLDHVGAYQLGYLDRQHANAWAYALHEEEIHCGDGMDRQHHSSSHSLRQREGTKMGPWVWSSGEMATPSTSMEYLSSMMEVRVYDPSKLHIVYRQSLISRLTQRGLVGRVSHPWFEEGTLPEDVLRPGHAILTAAGAPP